MTTSANVIAHSWLKGQPDLISLQVRFPWWLLPEANTHRVFSRNYGSTRAIPISRLINEAMTDPALPHVWTSHRAGMQGGNDLTEDQIAAAEEQFFAARDAAVAAAKAMLDIGIAKQNANRLLMPFIHVEGIITSTEWKNFFDLRCHPDADPTMRALAEAMQSAIQRSRPQKSFGVAWHLPYIDEATAAGSFSRTQMKEMMPWERLSLVSAARCARVSYKLHDGSNPDMEADLALAKRLLKSKHMSPFEHQARGGNTKRWWANFTGWEQNRQIIERPGRRCAV